MKLVNKALVYRDWKYTKWFIPILFLELFWFNIPGFINQDLYGTISLNAGVWIIAITLLFMASIMFSFDRNLSSYSLAASMPFMKREIIISKWLVGFYNIFVSYVSIYVIVNVILIINNCWVEHFLTSTWSFAGSLLFSLCVFGFILIIQSINGSVFLGGLISLLFVAIPYTFVYFLYNIYNRYSGIYIPYKGIVPAFYNTYDSACVMLAFLKSLLGMEVPNDGSAFPTIVDNQKLAYYAKLMDYWSFAKPIIYLAALIIMFIISIKLFNRSRLELNGRITTVESLNRIYKAVMAYYIGFLFHALFRLIAGYIAFRPDLVILFCFIIPVPFYFLIGKIIKIYNRRYA